MRNPFNRLPTAAAVAGAALLAAACGETSVQNNAAANASEADMNVLDAGNDQSALESATTAPEPAAPAEATTNATDTTTAPVTDGGDTGGNTLESNVSGM